MAINFTFVLLDSTMFNANDKQIDMITGLVCDQSEWLSDSGHVINNLLDFHSRIPIKIFGVSFHQRFAPHGVLVLSFWCCLYAVKMGFSTRYIIQMRQ